MKSLRKLSIITLSFFLIFLISTPVVQAKSKASPSPMVSSPSIQIDIREAYYGDLDGDGLEDDIYTRIELHLAGANRYNMQYWLTLILPSGQEFIFGWGINTRLNYVNLGHILYNTALEPGWYTLKVEILLKTGGLSYTESNYVFDPPGDGDPGAPPRCAIFLL